MTVHRLQLFIVLVFSSFCATVASSENWTRFRGPNGSGISEELRFPAQWTESNITWDINLPGPGHSSPVIWNGVVYITAANVANATRSLLAVQLSDGTTLWKKDYPLEDFHLHPLNSHATSTPTVDEKGVYSIWYNTDKTLIVALDHSGKELWTREVEVAVQMHGPSSSPAIYGDTIYFSVEQEPNNAGRISYWFALDRTTGETHWKLERSSAEKPSSATPLLYDDNWVIFSSKAHGVSAVEINTGKVAWETPTAVTARVVSSPIRFGDLILTTSGRRSQGIDLTAVQPPNQKSPKAQIAFTHNDHFVPYLSTPIYANALLFVFQDRGLISCLNPKTGEPIWSERIGRKFFGSPVLIGDQIYCQDGSGRVVVIRATDRYELLGENNLGESSSATPAISDGRMVLRTETRLICIAPDS